MSGFLTAPTTAKRPAVINRRRQPPAPAGQALQAAPGPPLGCCWVLLGAEQAKQGCSLIWLLLPNPSRCLCEGLRGLPAPRCQPQLCLWPSPPHWPLPPNWGRGSGHQQLCSSPSVAGPAAQSNGGTRRLLWSTQGKRRALLPSREKAQSNSSVPTVWDHDHQGNSQFSKGIGLKHSLCTKSLSFNTSNKKGSLSTSFADIMFQFASLFFSAFFQRGVDISVFIF